MIFGGLQPILKLTKHPEISEKKDEEYPNENNEARTYRQNSQYNEK